MFDLLGQADWGVFLYERTSNSGALVVALGAGVPAIASDLAYFRELDAACPGAIEVTSGSAQVSSRMWDRWAAQEEDFIARYDPRSVADWILTETRREMIWTPTQTSS